MKLTALFLVLGLLQVAARSTAQVTIKETAAPLEKVLKAIKKQTGYDLFFNETIVKAKGKPVAVNVNNVSVEEALNLVFQNQPQLTYSLNGKIIGVREKEEKKEKDIITQGLNPGVAPPLPIDIRGTVKNDRGEPVVGASVMIKGTRRGTSADNNGNFSITGVDENATLVISGTNIETVEMKVSGRAELVIVAKFRVSELDEVTVVNKGYYEEQKKFSLSNVARVTAKEIEQQPVTNPLLALQGRVPGMTIVQSSGVPGSGVTIRIQGRNNLENNMASRNFSGTDPLIIVDGVPYPSQNLRTFVGGAASVEGSNGILGISSESTGGRGGNPLAFLNPSDIESIDVLKDADATSIYGSRAANGAILITTRKGKPGRIKVDISAQNGWSTVAKKMQLLNTQQYMEMRREALYNDNLPIGVNDLDLRGLWDTTRYTDWQKELIGGTAQYTNIVVGISGGNTNTSYRLSATYNKEGTVYPGQFQNPKTYLNFSLNGSTPNQRLKFQLSANFGVNKNTLPLLDMAYYAMRLAPNAPPAFNSDGTVNYGPNDPLQGGVSTYLNNPFRDMGSIFETKTTNIISTALVSYRLLPRLNIQANFGYNRQQTDQFSAGLDNSVFPELRLTRQRFASFVYNDMASWNIEPTLNYQEDIGPGKLTLLAGFSFQEQQSNGRGLSVSGQVSDQLLKDPSAGSSVSLAVPDLSLYHYSAVFARAGYIIRDKYIINLTGRRDGSSRFGPGRQFGNFGSAALGWIFSQEKSVQKSLPFLSFGKLRASYGSTGSDQTGNYIFMSLYTSSGTGILYQSSPALNIFNLPNPILEWQQNKKLNFGLDLGFFKDRISLSLDYFRNLASNNLNATPLPSITGFNSLTENYPAVIQNAGLEITVGSTPVVSKKFKWVSNFNITFSKNKLKAFPGIETSAYANTLIVGQSLSVRKTQISAGVNPLNGTYNTIPANTTISANLANYFWDAAPKFFGGFQNRLTYKSLSVDFMFQFTKQIGTIPAPMSIPGSAYGGSGNQLSDVMQRWQKPGDIAVYPRFNSTQSVNWTDASGAVVDASYIRLKNIAISYQLADELSSKLHLQSARFYLNVENLLTFTRYRGLDPETMSLGNLPPLRTVVLGAQITL